MRNRKNLPIIQNVFWTNVKFEIWRSNLEKIWYLTYRSRCSQCVLRKNFQWESLMHNGTKSHFVKITLAQLRKPKKARKWIFGLLWSDNSSIMSVVTNEVMNLNKGTQQLLSGQDQWVGLAGSPIVPHILRYCWDKIETITSSIVAKWLVLVVLVLEWYLPECL